MIKVIDRIPAVAGQFKLTDSSGSVSNVKLERNDGATVTGTKVNKQLFDNVQKQLRCVRVTILPSYWSGENAPYTYTVSNISGMTENWVPGQPVAISVSDSKSNVPSSQYATGTTYPSVVEYNLAMHEALGQVTMITSSTGALTFACYEDKPDVYLDIRVPGMVSELDVNVGEFDD